MRYIKLTQGKRALVDDWNFEELNKYKWHASKNTCGGYYAQRNKDGDTISMHRQILELKYGDGYQADHVNHNTLDNRERNIRVCTNAENHHNQRITQGSSKFKGVCWNKKSKKWQSGIMIGGIQKYLGQFNNEVVAALRYDKAARRYFGEFALCNFYRTVTLSS